MRSLRGRALNLLAGTGLALSVVAAPALTRPLSVAAAALTSWPTYHLDNGRTGNDALDPAFPSVVRQWTSAVTMDGAVYAEPLINNNLVIAATENNSVYAFSTSTGTQTWHVSLGAPVTSSNLPCGNISPVVGVTGTPVIDAAAGVLYVAAMLSGGGRHYELFALDLNNSGATLWHETIAPTNFQADIQGQRGALALNGGNVYIPFGGRWGDCGNYRGWVVGAPATRSAPGTPFWFELPSLVAGGGFWASPGEAVDGSGNVYVTSGNTFSGGTFNYGESVLKLPANLSGISDYFVPSNWPALDQTDTDLGSVAPALLGNNLAFQVGKEGVGYLLNIASLGGSNHSTPLFSARVCNATTDAAFGGTAFASPYLFVPCSDQLVALVVASGSPFFVVAWRGPNTNGPVSPVVADGLVWTVDQSGTVLAQDPATGWQRFSDNLGSATHFATPAAANGQVFVAANRQISAFGAPPAAANTFYFAEGYTGTGFTTGLSMLLPNGGGTATIDYYTDIGHLGPFSVSLTQGQVAMEDVNARLGASREVSARVVLSRPGTVERVMHFNNGTWFGSTDIVGVNQASTEWDFGEGSTHPAYNEFLTLQNPSAGPVGVDLHYFTDGGAHPTKSLVLPANSRTTVEVFTGDLSDNASCAPGFNGTCGVGRGITGVSVGVVADAPIIAERPFYVNNFSFGAGAIRDGHVAFGAPQPALVWNFAEGTTLPGFNEYVTLQNPNNAGATVDLNYFTDTGLHIVKTLILPAMSRSTVLVFNGDLSNNASCNAFSSCGIGHGTVGVSLQVVSRGLPIVAERPMYMVHDFGSGPVAGAHVVVGATSLNTLFGFSAASTMAGENDYLTIENPNSITANVTITYYPGGTPIVRTFAIPPVTRHTVLVFMAAEGVGMGVTPLGIVVASDQPVLVEKPTYSSAVATFGATDTLGYTPPSGF